MARSIKGKDVNITELAAKNGKTIALGNASKNARGDLLGPGGKIVKTREQLANEYHTKGANLVKNVSTTEDIGKMFETPAPVVAPVLEAEPVVVANNTPKKKK